MLNPHAMKSALRHPFKHTSVRHYSTGICSRGAVTLTVCCTEPPISLQFGNSCRNHPLGTSHLRLPRFTGGPYVPQFLTPPPSPFHLSLHDPISSLSNDSSFGLRSLSLARFLFHALRRVNRTYPGLRATLEGLLVRSEGDSGPWRPPAEGRLTGSVDFQPLPPCMASMCNDSGKLDLASLSPRRFEDSISFASDTGRGHARFEVLCNCFSCAGLSVSSACTRWPRVVLQRQSST